MTAGSTTRGPRVFAMILLTAAIGFAVLTIVIVIDRIPLIVNGVATTGTVISVDPNARPSRRYGVVEFRDASGIVRRATTTSGVQHVGDPVRMRYLPSDPRHAAEDSFATIWLAVLVPPLVSLFLATASRAIWRGGSSSVRKKRR